MCAYTQVCAQVYPQVDDEDHWSLPPVTHTHAYVDRYSADDNYNCTAAVIIFSIRSRRGLSWISVIVASSVWRTLSGSGRQPATTFKIRPKDFGFCRMRPGGLFFIFKFAASGSKKVSDHWYYTPIYTLTFRFRLRWFLLDTITVSIWYYILLLWFIIAFRFLRVYAPECIQDYYVGYYPWTSALSSSLKLVFILCER